MDLPELFELPEVNEEHQSIKRKFENHWLSPYESPVIQHIYKIYPLESLENAYRRYRRTIEQKGDFLSQGLERGNERLRFHGTKRACGLGDRGGSPILCNQSRCSLCSIIMESFKLDRCGTNSRLADTAAGRFGRGIYTTPTSSKARRYCRNSESSRSPFLAMLLTKVVEGKSQKLRKSHVDFTEPSEGFDSVIGEPVGGSSGREPKYDELVVYKECAIIPAYLIIYDLDSVF